VAYFVQSVFVFVSRPLRRRRRRGRPWLVGRRCTRRRREVGASRVARGNVSRWV